VRGTGGPSDDQDAAERAQTKVVLGACLADENDSGRIFHDLTLGNAVQLIRGSARGEIWTGRETRPAAGAAKKSRSRRSYPARGQLGSTRISRLVATLAVRACNEPLCSGAELPPSRVRLRGASRSRALRGVARSASARMSCFRQFRALTRKQLVRRRPQTQTYGYGTYMGGMVALHDARGALSRGVISSRDSAAVRTRGSLPPPPAIYAHAPSRPLLPPCRLSNHARPRRRRSRSSSPARASWAARHSRIPG
jgi:hypothetical protein